MSLFAWFIAALCLGVWSFGCVMIGMFLGIKTERTDQYEARSVLNGNVVPNRRRV
jgi:hypothetical protein